jgi:hypothetical protein
MKCKWTKRTDMAKPFDVIVRCVNCDAVADSEDIKFGCARCIANEFGGTYSPRNWFRMHKDGGWYKP